MNIVIIGAGPAGRFAAMKAAENGENVTLIEKRFIGGKCLNQSCMVVCSLSDIAKHMLEANRFNDLELLDYQPVVKYDNITKKVKETQKIIRKIITSETEETGVDFIQGEASIDAENKIVTVNDEDYEYDKLLICTGSTPFIPPITGVENAYNYTDLLKLKEVPNDLIIIGGETSAAEFASIYSSLGSNVNILCRNSFLKNINDSEVEEYIVTKLLKNTVVHENVDIKQITADGVETSNGFINGTVLLATGVKPNSDLVKDIVKLDSKGNIITDEHMLTSNEDIYAAGDVVGGILATPVSRMEGMVAIHNICGKVDTPDYSIIPLNITLPYDLVYLTGTNVSSNGAEGMLPGAAGPGSFWHVLDGSTGLTKVRIDVSTGKVNNIISLSPNANLALPYIAKAMKENVTSSDFDNFTEIHPTTDGIFKLIEFFKRFN
ncbi:MAG: NAD(P)/FAD-dependent oxidoreductase [Methanobacteriaceae archaeon]|nr:NAD(P)/FAD-dependent oxidoreductase [Methanobacteriaceae archaeon]